MKRRDFSFDAITGTVTVTKAFADKLSNPASEEYKLLRQIKADYPSLAITKRTHRTKSNFVNQYKKLTYENMEAFISLLPNADELLGVFNSLRTCANLVSTSPYTLVRSWFVAQFPLYRQDPMFYLTADVVVLAPEKYLKEVKEGA